MAGSDLDQWLAALQERAKEQARSKASSAQQSARPDLDVEGIQQAYEDANQIRQPEFLRSVESHETHAETMHDDVAQMKEEAAQRARVENRKHAIAMRIKEQQDEADATRLAATRDADAASRQDRKKAKAPRAPKQQAQPYDESILEKPAPSGTMQDMVHSLKGNPARAREAFIWSEVFGPPKAFQ